MPGKGNAKKIFQIISRIISTLGVKESSRTSIVGFPGLS